MIAALNKFGATTRSCAEFTGLQNRSITDNAFIAE